MRTYTSLCLFAGTISTLLLAQGCADFDDTDDIAQSDIFRDQGAGAKLQNGKKFPNASGDSETFNPLGATDLTNEFFQALGSNGRRCVTCHDPADGWSIRPKSVQARFDATGGTDPLFRTNDGSNSPNADVSTVNARRKAYSMLLTKGVIRVGMPIPANAEFELIEVDDPYGFASAKELSVYRRPLPAANLAFLNLVMWDGRESSRDGLLAGLMNQANGATMGHAEGDSLSRATLESIVGLEFNLVNSQSHHDAAKELHAAKARGGPEHLALEDGSGRGFNIYDAWSDRPGGGVNVARRAIARGQKIFNDSCAGFCHDVGNVGNNSRGIFFDIGVSAKSRRTPDMPLYTFRNLKTGEIVETTDPGRALVTGRWNDMSKFKTPGVRGLAARAPYFHDGSAATLGAVVGFYTSPHFKGPPIALTAQEKADLVAFLEAL
ncbi:MAG TPA: hypothetical protein VK034_05165 [Enhygromyxa sp.]|nr:hypothetical protein [Enhygromyxa sp.]